MIYRNIIFDFDGVLAESVNIKTQAFYQLYQEYGENIAEKVVAHHRLNGGVSRYKKFTYYHKVFLNSNLSENDLKILSDKFSNMVVDGIVRADEVEGALWFLQKYQNECSFWVVSATPSKEINEIINRRNIAEYFIKIYGSPDNKSSIVKTIINENKLINNETVFIGDAMTDYIAAKNNNINFILRKTDENKCVFKLYPEIISFKNFQELVSKIK